VKVATVVPVVSGAKAATPIISRLS